MKTTFQILSEKTTKNSTTLNTTTASPESSSFAVEQERQSQWPAPKKGITPHIHVMRRVSSANPMMPDEYIHHEIRPISELAALQKTMPIYKPSIQPMTPIVSPQLDAPQAKRQRVISAETINESMNKITEKLASLRADEIDPQVLDSVSIYAQELLALGYSAEQLINASITQGSHTILPALAEHTKQLINHGFDINQIATMAETPAGEFFLIALAQAEYQELCKLLQAKNLVSMVTHTNGTERLVLLNQHAKMLLIKHSAEDIVQLSSLFKEFSTFKTFVERENDIHQLDEVLKTASMPLSSPSPRVSPLIACSSFRPLSSSEEVIESPLTDMRPRN